MGLLEPYINSQQDPVTEDYTAYYNCGALFRVGGTAAYGESFAFIFDANGVEVDFTITVADEAATSSSESEDVVEAEEEVNTVMRSILILSGIAVATTIYFAIL